MLMSVHWITWPRWGMNVLLLCTSAPYFPWMSCDAVINLYVNVIALYFISVPLGSIVVTNMGLYDHWRYVLGMGQLIGRDYFIYVAVGRAIVLGFIHRLQLHHRDLLFSWWLFHAICYQ